MQEWWRFFFSLSATKPILMRDISYNLISDRSIAGSWRNRMQLFQRIMRLRVSASLFLFFCGSLNWLNYVVTANMNYPFFRKVLKYMIFFWWLFREHQKTTSRKNIKIGLLAWIRVLAALWIFRNTLILPELSRRIVTSRDIKVSQFDNCFTNWDRNIHRKIFQRDGFGRLDEG